MIGMAMWLILYCTRGDDEENEDIHDHRGG